MAKYECVICGHIYDEDKGDPDSGTGKDSYERLT
jgi:rubredoxin